MMPPRLKFPKSIRLRKPGEFSAVYSSGVFEADHVLVMNLRSNGTETSRLGLSIPKKTGNAPLRNRWKRICREAFRTQQHTLPKGIDFVVRPRKGAAPDTQAVSKSLAKLLLRGSKKLERKS